jgi:dipeptidyl aminopeptidase/acylaminoacyl peptidase
VYVVTPGDEEPTRITEAPNASTLGWADDETLLWAGWQEREPQSSGTVWACPAHTDGVPRVVGTTPDEPRCTIGLAYSASGGRALLVVADGLDNRLEWLDPATGGREVAATLAGEVDVGAVVHAIGGPVVALVHYGTELEPQVQAGDPSALTTLESVPTTWSAAGAESERGPDAAAEHDSVELGTVSALACHASDGTALDAVVIRPHGDAQEPVPTVVLVHGGPYGRSSVWAHAHALDWGQLLATRGYAVVMPNYRGSYGRGNAFATAARGDMGGIEWGDVLAVVDAAIDAGIADPDRLGIGGWSQGGFLTAWAVTATDRFKAAVMGAGVSDWGMMAATSDLPAFEAALGGSRPWDGPGPHRAATGSPISFARRRTTPLLILHGAEDQRVPVTQAIAFRRAMADQDSPLELVTYPREPHGIRERRHQIDVQERVVAWYDRFLR